VTKFIRCEQCDMKVAGDKCEFAVHARVVDGEKHVFCCEKCAERYEKKRRG
jgi:hypothetical protein